MTCDAYDVNGVKTKSPPLSLQAIIDKVFAGRGGGLALLISSVTMVTIDVTGCKFQRNFATSAGGGAYVALGQQSNHMITFQSCDFEDNVAGDYGGGMEIDFGRNGNETLQSHIIARDCHFLNNEAPFGGAVYVGMYLVRCVVHDCLGLSRDVPGCLGLSRDQCPRISYTSI